MLSSSGLGVALRRGAGRGLRARRRGERRPLTKERDAGAARHQAWILRGSLIEAAQSACDPVRARVVEVNRRRRCQFFHGVLPRAGR